VAFDDDDSGVTARIWIPSHTLTPLFPILNDFLFLSLYQQQGLCTKKVYVFLLTELRLETRCRRKSWQLKDWSRDARWAHSSTLSLYKWLGQVLEYLGPWGNHSLANNLSFPLWTLWWHCTYHQYCPPPPAPTRQIPHRHVWLWKGWMRTR